MQHSTPTAHAPTQFSYAGLMSICLMVLMATLDMSIVNVALPTLAQELHTDFATIQWAILSYVLVLTCLMLTISRLGDMFGKKTIFARGLVLFTLSSLACGMAMSPAMLIGCRALQGVGAAMSQALGLAIVMEIVPPQHKGRAIGIIGGTVSAGLAAGPSVGGILIGYFGWRSIFLINVPLGILAWIMFQKNVPVLPPADKGARFDFPGAIVLLVALGCYCLGMTWGQNMGFFNPFILALLGVGCVLAIVFFVIEKNTKEPMLDLSLFKNPLFSCNLLMNVFMFAGLTGIFMAPFYLELALGFEPQTVGFLLMSVPLCMGIVSPFAGSLADKHNPRYIYLFGLGLMLAGCLSMTTLTTHTTWLGYLLRSIPLGLGLGCFQSPNNTSIMNAVPRDRLGIASGLLNYARVFGQTSGLPLMGAFFTAILLRYGPLPTRTDFAAASPEALAAALSGTYAVSSVVVGINVFIAMYTIWVKKKRN